MAISTKVITMRQGNKSDYQPSKMLSGELAVINDAEELHFSPKTGKSIRVATENDLKKVGNTIDDALSETSTNPVQNKVVTAKFRELSGQIPNQSGLTNEAKTALLNCFKNVAWTVSNGQDYYDALESALNNSGGEEPDVPTEVTLVSISVTYVGGSVTEGTNVNDLTGITVKAHYSNGSMKTVTDYTLSGTIVEGVNTVTVTYEGKTTTFSVVGVSSESTVTYYTITNNLTNVTTDNPLTSIAENNGYTAILTPSTDYEFETITVTMGGVNVTSDVYTDGTIVISAVTGNVVITATAKEIKQESGEITLLKNIAFDGTSYLDTEIIPESVNYRYVMGIQAPNKDVMSAGKCFGGISMRNNTDHSKSSYWDLYWGAQNAQNNYNTNIPVFYVDMNCMGVSAVVHTGQDKGDGLSSQAYDNPLYYDLSNGSQSAWLNEELTETPVYGHFKNNPMSVMFSNNNNYTDDEHPIESIWLGKVHVTGIMSNLATEANTYAGVKFYCFKVYDTDENLIADMRPAKQGSKIGMYCNVRQRFFEGNGTVTYEELEVE